MFVADEVLVDVSFAAARTGLAKLAKGSLLRSTSQAAYDAEITGLARVGPAGFTRLVSVQVRELASRRDRAGLAIRWEATGPGGSLFPVLDADLRLSPAGENSTLLTLEGAYRPPFGALGAALDRAILHRVAAATVRRFIKQVAAGITSQASAGAAATGPALRRNDRS
jgi:hypothetical protein